MIGDTFITSRQAIGVAGIGAEQADPDSRYNVDKMRRRRSVLRVVLGMSLVAVPLVGLWQRQSIFDWAQLRDYTPPAAIASLAEADSMNEKAKRIFYVNHPKLTSDTTSFRQACSISEQTIILGCYHPGQRGIFVYDVQDERLSGIEEVTSAHEMLHAAYDRLSSKDRNDVDKMLNDFYKNDLKDQRVQGTIEAYKKTEPNDIVNEMHSIFGTEITNLPSALENYYNRYFINRAAVVAFSQNYESEFTSRSARAQQYEAQLNGLKQKIEGEEASLRAQSERINTEQARLDSLRNSGQVDQYNAGVAAYNAGVNAYNAGVAGYKRDINNYNALVEQYNAIAGELKQLYGAIDTRLIPKAQ